MDKKRKQKKRKMSGTFKGMAQATGAAIRRCDKKYKDDNEPCVKGISMTISDCISDYPQDMPSLDKCKVGVKFYQEELKKLPKSLAGKKRRR